MFEFLKFWKKAPPPAPAYVPPPEPLGPPEPPRPSFGDLLVLSLDARRIELRAQAAASESPALQAKLRGRADEVDYLIGKVLEQQDAGS